MPQNHTTQQITWVRLIGEAGIQKAASEQGRQGHEGAGFTKAFYMVPMHRENMKPVLTVEVSQLTAGHVVATGAELPDAG